jgi:hypothetical protein
VGTDLVVAIPLANLPGLICLGAGMVDDSTYKPFTRLRTSHLAIKPSRSAHFKGLDSMDLVFKPLLAATKFGFDLN